MSPVMLLTAGLLLGQAQEAQVIVQVQYQQAPAPGLFGRWRANMQERPVLSKLQDRFGGIFGRNQKQEPKVQGGTVVINGTTTTPPQDTGRVVVRVTTDEPPLLETPAPVPGTPTSNSPNR